MSGFSGFTEADIRKVKNGQNLSKNPPENNKPKVILKQKKVVIKDNKNHKYLSKLSPVTDLMPIPEEAKLFAGNLDRGKQKEGNITDDFKTCQTRDNSNEDRLQDKSKTEEDISKETHSRERSNVRDEINLSRKEDINSLNKEDVNSLSKEDINSTRENNPSTKSDSSEKKCIDLEEFQTKQKLMEEQNRRRKELLAKALEDRTKRTLEEQQRLNKIQDEFKKLDANLSNDVKVLRKQIELASVDYMEAQKKYLRVEREFLDAKLYLHKKLERKEMLTEYLCAIIEKNEERKAEKLNELLEKLNVREDESAQVCDVSTSNN